jgi:nucleotide-binding universal stress UspA family protein
LSDGLKIKFSLSTRRQANRRIEGANAGRANSRGPGDVGSMKTAPEIYWEKPEAPRSPFSIRRILAPISWSEPSWDGVEYAIGVARKFDAELILLLVQEVQHAADYSVNFQDYGAVDEQPRNAETGLTERCEAIRKRHALTQALFRVGIPCEEILQASKELKADLVVGSGRNLGWYRHFLLPTTEAPCTIMVVPS